MIKAEKSKFVNLKIVETLVNPKKEEMKNKPEKSRDLEAKTEPKTKVKTKRTRKIDETRNWCLKRFLG